MEWNRVILMQLAGLASNYKDSKQALEAAECLQLQGK
jgi:hypothetical protein